MISDVLFHASKDIGDYLRRMPDVYAPDLPITVRIKALTAEMDAVRAILDGAPGTEDESEG